MKFHIKYLLLICVLLAGAYFNSAWAEDMVFTQTSTTAGTFSGAPAGVTVSFSTSHTDMNQLTNENAQTLTLKGMDGYKITQIVLRMRSNTSKGAGKLSYSTNGGSSFSYLAGSAGAGVGFNTSDWYGSWSTSYVDVTKSNLNIACGESDVIIKIEATANSLYCRSYTITYEAYKTPAGLTFGTHENETYTVLPDASFTPPTLSNPNSLTVAFATNDEDVAAVDAESGTITIGTKEGTATITASSASNETYMAGSAKYKIKVQKGTSTVTLNNTELSFNILDGTTQTLTGTPKYNDEAIDGAAVTWSVVSGSDHVSVSDAGVVTALAPGSATIRASYAGSTVYAASYADCAVTVNKANTELTLDETSVAQDLKDGRTVTLTPTVKALKSDDSKVTLVSPTVTWTSSDETVATASGGVVTGLKAGDVTITASYAGGDNYNAASDIACDITFTDTRTAVNIFTFTAAKTTLIIGDEQATAITNDQTGWTAAYTYTSSDEDVATVDENGVITAVTKGTATITATLNISLSETGYKAGTTASKTIDITVTKPFHTATFSVNGNTDLTASVEEEQAITFPIAVETTPGDNEFAKVINGQTFVGWYIAEYSNASVAPEYVDASSANMGYGDVTYYAVFADYVAAVPDYVTDVLTPSGISNPSSYSNWSGKTATSSAVYAGHSTGGTSKIQINADNPKGIVSTTSGGRVSKVTLVWDNSTSSGRTVQVYGSNTAYTSSSDLFDNSKKGTLLGTIVYGTSTELNVTGDYKYVGLRSSANALYLSSVSIKWDKGTPAGYNNYTTDNRASAGIAFTNASVDVKLTSGYTGQALTNPNSLGVTYSSTDETVATVNSLTGVITELLKAGSTTITASYPGNATYKPAVASYDLNVTEKIPHGLAYAVTEVEKLTTDAAFTNTLTNGNSLAVSYSSSATGVATVNSSTGEVTIKGAGETTITATFAGDEDYEAGNASYTLTVSKATPTLAFASANATGREGKPFAGNALSNPASLTVAYSSSDEDVATVDEETGEISIVAGGTTTITASFAGNDTYLAANPSYTLKVLFAPTFTLSDQSVNYGKTYTVDEGDITGGAITVTSGNTAIATVDGLVITSAAVGAVEITVSTAEDETYDAGSATFNLTVNAPTGKTSTPGGKTTTFTDKDLHYSSGGVAWTASQSANSFESASSSRGVQFGAAIGEFTLSTSAITGVVTKVSMVLSTNGSGNTVSVKVGDTNFKYNNSSTLTLTDGDSKVERDFVGEASGTIVISCNDTKKSIYFKSITVYTKTNADVTIPSSGFGTFCYQYPLDLDLLDENAKAYIVTSVEGNNVTLKRITGTIKGGVPFILYGESGAHTLYTAESSSTVPASNMLVGTLAPTYITATNGDYTNFGMKSGKFVKAANGVMPANKAYLPVLTSSLGGGAREFNFIFDDDTTTGIRQTENLELRTENAVYDLQGRKVAQPTRGGLYIVNGRKVVIK